MECSTFAAVRIRGSSQAIRHKIVPRGTLKHKAMLFYKVNKESDQKRTNNKNCDFLIANELYTESEIVSAGIGYKFLRKNFTPVSISKFRTYWFFGARFENKLS